MRKIKIVETELEDYPINNGKVTVIKKIPKFGAPPLLFRADTRSVKVIRNSGFNARNLDFKLDDAKKYVRDSFSQSCNSALVWSIAGTQSMAGKWISTADERSCMGYESKVRPHNIPEINSKDDFAKLPNGAIYVFKIT